MFTWWWAWGAVKSSCGVVLSVRDGQRKKGKQRE